MGIQHSKIGGGGGGGHLLLSSKKFLIVTNDSGSFISANGQRLQDAISKMYYRNRKYSRVRACIPTVDVVRAKTTAEQHIGGDKKQKTNRETTWRSVGLPRVVATTFTGPRKMDLATFCPGNIDTSLR